MENELMSFINKTPNAYICIENLKEILNANGFEELFECDKWESLENGKNYYVTRNDSSLIAFKMCKKNFSYGFNIAATHVDSPCFFIKPNCELYDNMYLKLNVSGYGGLINYSWLDRPLSLAGRVVILNKGTYEKKMININKDLLVIPSQAIHINRDVNEKNELNKQIDMLPIISLDNNKDIKTIIREELEKMDVKADKICDYDLYLYNRDESKKVGLNDEFILAPRLDDLAGVYPTFKAFINSSNNYSINVFCAFNNEEVGSMTQQGADSSFLLDVLSRVSTAANLDMLIALNNSFIASVDNSHANHPNVIDKNDITNRVELNKGLVIKHDVRYTTDAVSSSIFKGVCENAEVPCQDYTCRADMKSGSTLGKISQKHVSIDSVDVGIAQLAMHSANELIGAKDVKYMYDAILELYNTTFVKQKGKIKLLHK